MTPEEREALILDNQKLVYVVAQKLMQGSVIDEDTFQTGMIGLIKAADIFDESKGYKFTALASACIRTELITAWRKENRAPPQYLMRSLSEVYADEAVLEDFIAGNADVDYCYSNDFPDALTEKERMVLRLLILGYKQPEISRIIGDSKQNISRIYKHLVEKYNDFYKEKNNA